MGYGTGHWRRATLLLLLALAGCSQPNAPATDPQTGVAPHPDPLRATLPAEPEPAPAPERTFGSDSVLQAFLQMPEAAYLPPRALRHLTEGEKLALIARRDVSTGYLVLRATPDLAWEGTTQMGFFRLAAGNGYLVVSNITDCSIVPQCADSFSAWEFKNSTWQNTTEATFAALHPTELDARWRRLGLQGPPITRQHLGLDIPPRGLDVHCFVNYRGGSPRIATFRFAQGRLQLLP